MKDLSERIDRNISRIPDFPKKGVQFKDITSIFYDPDLCTDMVNSFASYSRGKVDVVCGVESRGFLFGIQIAREIGVPFVLVRKKGKLPPPIIFQEYELEYGKEEIQMKEGALKKGDRVLIHDDILATGGTASACAKLVEKCGGIVSQYSFISELCFFNGRKILEEFTKDIQVLVKYMD